MSDLRVLMLVQLVDEGEWLRGFIVTWIRKLADRVSHVDVVTLELGDAALPANVSVYSMGKEKGFGRARLLLEFHRIMAHIGRDADVYFSHMTPLYTLIAAPYAALFHKPQVMWFVHRSVTPILRLAHKAAARVVTASPESYGILGDKVDVLGHGIDLEQFKPSRGAPEGRLILSVGRLAPIKNHEALLEGAARLFERPGFENVQIAIAGGTTGEFPEYERGLRTLAESLGVSNRVEFLGAVPPSKMPTLYQRAALSVNLCPTGGMDKAVLESMACGLPVLVHNRTFLPLLGQDAGRLWSETLEAGILADRLAALLTLNEAEREAISQRLLATVREGYSLDALIDRLVRVFETLQEGHPGI